MDRLIKKIREYNVLNHIALGIVAFFVGMGMNLWLIHGTDLTPLWIAILICITVELVEWEIFVYAGGRWNLNRNFIIDTLVDLFISDVIGLFIGYFLLKIVF